MNEKRDIQLFILIFIYMTVIFMYTINYNYLSKLNKSSWAMSLIEYVSVFFVLSFSRLMFVNDNQSNLRTATNACFLIFLFYCRFLFCITHNFEGSLCMNVGLLVLSLIQIYYNRENRVPFVLSNIISLWIIYGIMIDYNIIKLNS